MDVPRKDASRNRMIRRMIYAVIVICAIPLITMGYMRLKPAAPPVERATVWIDSVKRGPMVMQRRGIGTLKPEEVLFIPAATDGRVDKILLRPGTTVTADSVLLELSNPELQLAAVDLEWQVKAAEASLVDLRVRLATQRLDLKSNAAHVKSDFNQAKLKAEVEQKLAESGLTSDINIRIAKETANDLAARTQIEEERVAISGESMQAQLDAQKVQIEKLRAAYVLKKKQVDELKVRAGAAGVLQELPVEVGQRLTPGTLLAKVAQPWKLKAVLQIPETQAKDIALGQKAEIDTRNGIILGKVIRIDPAVINGTRTVDVKLEGELPGGAVPDLSVDGTIELERLDDVLYVGRPVFGQPNSMVTVFKLDSDGREASRVQVKLGRTSVNTIEILEGLKVGDNVILSDMSAQDQHNRIRLN
jgi:HlyD family secretion protein